MSSVETITDSLMLLTRERASAMLSRYVMDVRGKLADKVQVSLLSR